ncbi:unnamed protein product [Darwinula stevensoni]|uniref:Uncharacterized protein n=1 Tax=Darwinula stevensoni TaxID=69355 RepID=A0A7R8X4C5_9CRUS|nr:unnamed protein product [Darwinula stevensoni]CAG0885852.1 unnamed protein product [Darwinula stevensoni]
MTSFTYENQTSDLSWLTWIEKMGEATVVVVGLVAVVMGSVVVSVVEAGIGMEDLQEGGVALMVDVVEEDSEEDLKAAEDLEDVEALIGEDLEVVEISEEDAVEISEVAVVEETSVVVGAVETSVVVVAVGTSVVVEAVGISVGDVVGEISGVAEVVAWIDPREDRDGRFGAGGGMQGKRPRWDPVDEGGPPAKAPYGGGGGPGGRPGYNSFEQGGGGGFGNPGYQSGNFQAGGGDSYGGPHGGYGGGAGNPGASGYNTSGYSGYGGDGGYGAGGYAGVPPPNMGAPPPPPPTAGGGAVDGYGGAPVGVPPPQPVPNPYTDGGYGKQQAQLSGYTTTPTPGAPPSGYDARTGYSPTAPPVQAYAGKETKSDSSIGQYRRKRRLMHGSRYASTARLKRRREGGRPTARHPALGGRPFFSRRRSQAQMKPRVLLVVALGLLACALQDGELRREKRQFSYYLLGLFPGLAKSGVQAVSVLSTATANVVVTFTQPNYLANLTAHVVASGLTPDERYRLSVRVEAVTEFNCIFQGTAYDPNRVHIKFNPRLGDVTADANGLHLRCESQTR